MSDCSSDCDHSVRCCGDLPQLRVTLPVILVLPILQPACAISSVWEKAVMSGCITPKDSTMTDRNISADSVPRMESRHPTGRMPSSVDGRIAMPAPVRDVRDYCESMGEDLDDFESDVGANYKLRYEVQEIDTASERKMSTLTLLQSGCFLTD